MSSDPLSLWQVLKEEYESFHGPLPTVYLYIKNPRKVAARLKDSQNPLSNYLVGHLSATAQKDLSGHQDAGSLPESLQNELTDILNARLTDQNLYLQYHAGDASSFAKILTEADVKRTAAELSKQPLTEAELLRVNRLILETAYPEMIADIQGDLKGIYSLIHRKQHSALCFSGGGIRSATFNLGILQGLARHGLLEKFDYLSTVSGGGYTGGWLSAWIHRQGLEEVVKQLSSSPTSPVEPEPKPLVHLRAFSNYLSPRLGLTADTWTMVATLVRNIFLNWLVFIPLLMALLMWPRLWLSFLYGHAFEGLALGFKATFHFPLSLAIGFVAASTALIYIGMNLPSTEWKRGNGRRFALWALLPMLIAAMSFATFWARDENLTRVKGLTVAIYEAFGLRVVAEAAHDVTLRQVIYYALALLLLPLIICFGYRLLKAKNKLVALGQIGGAVLLIVIAQLIAASLAWLGATQISFFNSPRDHLILYSCLALPLLLGLLMLTGTLISGLTSRFTEDDDQEWWARSGSWLYIISLVWVVCCALVLYGPYLFEWLSQPLSSWKPLIASLGIVASVISGAVSIFGGFSGRTPANEQEAKKAGGGGLALQAATKLLGPVFLAFIFILLSFATGGLLTLLNYLSLTRSNYLPGWLLTLLNSLPGVMKSRLRADPAMPSSAIDHLGTLLHSTLGLLALLFLLLAALGWLMSLLISTNKFSLHYFWRNRIIRAYLGASNDHRQENPFTHFDTEDNISMHELRPYQPGSPVKNKPLRREKKLLHVLNFALNLVGSKELAWQERMAESFTASPLHAGNYRLGYRKAMDYGRRLRNGKQGISLGTSVAISGAFASPNMGYMMTSPVIRFLMTLFNVRFGWWLGNPGKEGAETYDRSTPFLSALPIFQEALGMTDDKAKYVYLSDGGHFENLGLYEMVLRRCRLIVVGDGSSDGKFTFQALGQAIRQIRVDFGVPIDFEKFHITGRSLDGKGTYCAIGKIRYSCVDGGGEDSDGVVIFIKAALLGDEPRDVLNYASEHTTFPHEFIGDQWFSESQFESYRALGSHIVDALCRVGKKMEDRNTFTDLQEFRKNLEDKLAEISLTDFEQKLLDNLEGIPKGIGEVLAYLKTPNPTGGAK